MARYPGALKTSSTCAVVSMVLIMRIPDRFSVNLSLSARNINQFSILPHGESVPPLIPPFTPPFIPPPK
jgi:hypothetical protein